METIAKFIKAFFLGADGEVDATTLLKFKRCLLWVILGVGLTIGALILWVDSDEEMTSDEPEPEYVYVDEDGNIIDAEDLEEYFIDEE